MHKARVKVTLNDDASIAIRRLSEVSGESMSSIISGLFDLNLSHVEQMTELLEQAADIRSQFPEHGRHLLRSAFGYVRNEIESMDLELQQSGELSQPIESVKSLSDVEIAGMSLIATDSAVSGSSLADSFDDTASDIPQASAVEPWQGFYDE